MSNVRQTKPLDALPNRWDLPAWDEVSETLIRITLVVAASAIMLRLTNGNGVHVGPTEMLILGGVLIAAAGFGLITGLLAAAIGLVAYHQLANAALPPMDLRSRDTFLLVMFGLSVSFIGFYTDTVRQRHRQERSLLEAARPLSARASERAVGRYFDFAKQKGPVISRAPSLVEARRALASLCIVGAGLTAAIALRGALGSTVSMLSALGAVLLVAGLMGARFGLAAGVSVGVVLTIFLRAPSPASLPQPMIQAFTLAAFATFGWSVGLLADRMKHERAAVRTLVDASRDLSAGTDEATSRQVLFDSLCQIAKGGVVQIFDENGALLQWRGERPGSLAATSATDQVGRWRSQRLAADGRDVGVVRWCFPGSDRNARVADQIAMSLIELGASAIVRTRLNAERAEMEYVARAEHLRTVLLDAVSHHFRSPLAGILGSVTSILNLPDRHDRSVSRAFLLIIKEQANRLSRYVDNFLSLARLESGSLEFNIAEVNLEGLIYDVWETFGEVGSARRYLHVEVDQDTLQSDANLLTQIFGNVLENAIKYSPEESVVRIQGRRAGDKLVVDISDQGCGVPADSVQRMFERFYRSQGATAPGLGLGLYITRSLIEMLGGEVSARNRSDGGTGLIVSLVLPTGGTFIA